MGPRSRRYYCIRYSVEFDSRSSFIPLQSAGWLKRSPSDRGTGMFIVHTDICRESGDQSVLCAVAVSLVSDPSKPGRQPHAGGALVLIAHQSPADLIHRKHWIRINHTRPLQQITYPSYVSVDQDSAESSSNTFSTHNSAIEHRCILSITRSKLIASIPSMVYLNTCTWGNFKNLHFQLSRKGILRTSTDFLI